MESGFIRNNFLALLVMASFNRVQNNIFVQCLFVTTPLEIRIFAGIYCDVPGSPCLSQTGPVVSPSFSIFSGLCIRLVKVLRKS